MAGAGCNCLHDLVELSSREKLQNGASLQELSEHTVPEVST